MCFQINTIVFNDVECSSFHVVNSFTKRKNGLVSDLLVNFLYLDFPRRTNIKVAYIRYIDKRFRYGTLTVS